MKETIVFIILAILYFPIVLLIIKKGKRKVVFTILAILSSPIVFFVIWFNFPFYYLTPFEGKVVDSDTKEPIEGAAVLAVYYGSIPTISGSKSFPMDAQETLTDENGKFKIPEVKIWFGDKSGDPRGKITIFKPGYGVFPTHRQARAIGVNKSWPPPNKYILYEMPKLKTRGERDKYLPVLHLGDISKGKYNTLLKLLNEERTYLGYDKLPID